MRDAGTLLVFCLATLQGVAQAIHYKENIDYSKFIKEGTGTLNLDTCYLDDYLDEPVYEDYDNECYIDKLPDIYQNAEQNCCGFDGVEHITGCRGTDARGNEISIRYVPICQYPDTTNRANFTIKTKLECDAEMKCESKQILLSFNEPTNFKIVNDKSIQIDGKKYDAGFCLAHTCEGYDEGWSTVAEVCDCNFGDYIETTTTTAAATATATTTAATATTAAAAATTTTTTTTTTTATTDDEVVTVNRSELQSLMSLVKELKDELVTRAELLTIEDNLTQYIGEVESRLAEQINIKCHTRGGQENVKIRGSLTLEELSQEKH